MWLLLCQVYLAKVIFLAQWGYIPLSFLCLVIEIQLIELQKKLASQNLLKETVTIPVWEK